MAVVLFEELQNELFEVGRRWWPLDAGKGTDWGRYHKLINWLCSPDECSAAQKETFCKQYKKVLFSIPATEVILLSGTWMGMWARSQRRTNIFILDLVYAMQWKKIFWKHVFPKKSQHLITYKSGSSST